MDNLSNSKIEVLDKIKSISKYPENIFFFKGDTTKKRDILDVFSQYLQIDAVIHFASLKAVNDSIKMPLLYYKTNINSLIHLLEVMEIYNCNKLLFSSSATVYGGQQNSPLCESMITGINITNPYGQTKYMQEQILQDYAKTNEKMSIVILRYFNPVGAHSSGVIGEDPNGIPNNLLPFILKVASKEYEMLQVFGNNYNTPDGSCIRDFIHIMDVAEGHSKVITTVNKPGIHIYNLGTGKGTSVLELITTFEKVNNIIIPYQISKKREGDIDASYSDVSKIYHEIGWRSKYSLEDICKDAYQYLLKRNL
uniref:UDP-glucose 4-epimerase n=1 Tax=viral metagenome TaxID=1070528 RepID=A0A6C0LBS0_9ZZZZ